jgi:hypothetical protein
LAVDSQTFLGELGFFAPCWGKGNNLKNILLISPLADLSDPVSPVQNAQMQIYNSSGGRNTDFRMQEIIPLPWSPWGVGYSLICLGSPDPTSSPSETSNQLLLERWGVGKVELLLD